jgi:hypothetical protein
MTTQVGVGRSLSRDSREAGLHIGAQALAPLQGRPPSIVLLFSTAGHDQEVLVRALGEATGGAPLVGCSAEGIISREGSEELSHAAVAAAIASEDIVFDSFFAPDFGVDSVACGRALARDIRARGRDPGLLILFPDGVMGNCRELLSALAEELQGAHVIVGGTAGDALTFEKTFQFHDGIVASGGVAALLVSGAVVAEISITHGCRPIGLEREVTRVDGGLVCEIDGEPAWSFFKSYLPEGAETLEALHVAHLLLAEKTGSPDDEFGDFSVRVPIRLDRENSALYFAAGIAHGARVKLAIRDVDAVCERAIVTARKLKERRPDEHPLLVLQLDCAGRGTLLFGDKTTARLIAPVQDALGGDFPWIGLHTYGEIAAVGGKTSFHNYTAVLCALYAAPMAGAHEPR